MVCYPFVGQRFVCHFLYFGGVFIRVIAQAFAFGIDEFFRNLENHRFVVLFEYFFNFNFELCVFALVPKNTSSAQKIKSVGRKSLSVLLCQKSTRSSFLFFLWKSKNQCLCVLPKTACYRYVFLPSMRKSLSFFKEF